MDTRTEDRMTFDVAVCDKISKCFSEVLAEHPEVAALSCAVAWRGALNDADLHHFVWTSADGLVFRPDEVFGSLFQTLRLAERQIARAFVLYENLRGQVVAIGKEAVDKHAKAIKAAADDSDV